VIPIQPAPADVLVDHHQQLAAVRMLPEDGPRVPGVFADDPQDVLQRACRGAKARVEAMETDLDGAAPLSAIQLSPVAKLARLQLITDSLGANALAHGCTTAKGKTRAMLTISSCSTVNSGWRSSSAWSERRGPLRAWRLCSHKGRSDGDACLPAVRRLSAVVARAGWPTLSPVCDRG
jgi:hypothetical protein